MRRTEARSRGNDRPDGVRVAFQVRTNKVEPSTSVRACNLLAKDCDRASLSDETPPVGPKVAGVFEAPRLAGAAEGLAGATSCPNRSIVGPSGHAQGCGPDSDAGEEVALGVAAQVVGLDILDAPGVDVAVGDEAGGDKVAQPLRAELVDLVEVGWLHAVSSGEPSQ
jgi:hypothetical protein